MQEELEHFKVAKARKEAAIATAKTLSESVKSVFGQSSKDKEIKALREQIKAKDKEIFSIRTDMIGLTAQTARKEEEFKEKLTAANRTALSKYNEIVAKYNSSEKEKATLRKEIRSFQEIPIIERCLATIRSYVFHQFSGGFDAEDRILFSFVMQGNEDTAEILRRAAYNQGGVICQYQYGSRWDQAERELRNIANGIREEEQQQRSRGLKR